MKFSRVFLSIAVVSVLFGGSTPPLNPSTPLEDWVASMLVKALSCDDAPSNSSNSSGPGKPSTPQSTQSTSGGVDVNNPNQVRDAIKDQTVKGDKNAAAALIVLSGIRRAEYMQKGDAARSTLQIAEARKNYEEALKWSDDNTRDQLMAKIQIYYRVSFTYSDEAKSAGLDTLKGRDADRKSVEYLLKGADLIPNDIIGSKAIMYSEAAEKLARYDRNGACSLWKKTLAMPQDDWLTPRLQQHLQTNGCQ